jgi:hypothetical protein
MSTRAVTPTAAAPIAALTPLQRPVLQRTCDCGQHTSGGGECEECKKKKKVPLQRHASGGGALPVSPVAPPIVHEVLRSPGRPLEEDTRTFMESRFRHDFSQVRVHTDQRSAESAHAVSAHAYTVGRHVVFGAGEYRPRTSEGRSLLSHELTHVVQQSAVPESIDKLQIGEVQDAAEREAEHVEKAEVLKPLSAPSPISQPRLQGKWDWGRAGWGTLIGGGIGLAAGAVALAAGAPLVGLALLGGGLLAGFIIGGATGSDEKSGPPEKDPTKIENPPKCGPEQLVIIIPAMAQAAKLVSQALTRFVAYKNAAKDPANKLTHDQLIERFHSDTAETVGRVERVISTLNGRLSSPNFQFECHAATGICAPPFAAYEEESTRIVFCPSFFGKGLPTARMLIHEMTHALVGGAPIRDPGYHRERIFKRLSTDQALTNAESFAEFIEDIATGTPVPAAAPEDNVNDCPADWKEPIREAIAKAERWVTNAINHLANPKATDWGTLSAKYLPPTFPVNVNFAVSTASIDLERALKVYRATNDKLHTAIHFVCQPTGGAPCDKGGSVAWLGATSNFFVCADWKTKNADDQVVSMLGGLFGYLAGLDDPAWRTGLARIAFEITRTNFRTPPHAEVVGNATWSPDAISINFEIDTPKPAAKTTYQESGTKHERLSADLPVYEGPMCGASNLPFDFSVTFFVDSVGQERPGPFQAPKVAMDYSLGAPGGIRGAQSDPSTTIPGSGFNLHTSLKFPVQLNLNKNGPFHIKITLDDPDSGVKRIYEDVFEVLAVRPCDVPQKIQKPGLPGGPGMDPRKRKPETAVS